MTTNAKEIEILGVDVHAAGNVGEDGARVLRLGVLDLLDPTEHVALVFATDPCSECPEEKTFRDMIGPGIDRE